MNPEQGVRVLGGTGCGSLGIILLFQVPSADSIWFWLLPHPFLHLVKEEKLKLFSWLHYYLLEATVSGPFPYSCGVGLIKVVHPQIHLFPEHSVEFGGISSIYKAWNARLAEALNRTILWHSFPLRRLLAPWFTNKLGDMTTGIDYSNIGVKAQAKSACHRALLKI